MTVSPTLRLKFGGNGVILPVMLRGEKSGISELTPRKADTPRRIGRS
jgi:hypothetical protein